MPDTAPPNSPRGDTGSSYAPGPIHNAEWAIVPYTPLPMGSNVPIIAVTSPDGATAFIDTRDRRNDRLGQGRTQSLSDIDELRARTQAREALEAEEEMEEEMWEEAVSWEEMPVVDWGQVDGDVPAEFFGGGEVEDDDETEEEDKEDKTEGEHKEDNGGVEEETGLVVWTGQQGEVVEGTATEHKDGEQAGEETSDVVWTGEQDEEGGEETATATEHSSGQQPEEQGEEMSVVVLGGHQQEVVEEAAVEHWEGVGPSGEHLNGPFAARGVPSRRWSF